MDLGEVFIIESNSAGNGVSAIQYAKEFGYKTHFLTGIPEKYKNMKVNPLLIADQVTEIDTVDIIKLLHFMEDKDPLAILTFDDFHIVQTSIVAQSNGNVHPDINGLLNVRFKDKARRKIEGIGRSVAFNVLSVHETGETSPIGTPCVVKPVDESGSVGVRICFTDEEYREAIKPLQTLKTNITGYKYMQQVLVEEYVEGDEYSAELIWNREQEEWKLLGYTKKLISELPYCIEVGHVFPYSFGDEEDKSVLDTLQAWLKAVNLTNCAAHVEFKMSNGEPVLMEINPRPAGGFINELVRLVKGRDLVSAYVDMSVGRPFDETMSLSNGKFAAIRFVLPPKPGMIRNILPPAQHIKGIVQHTLKNGELKVKGVTSGDDRIGHVISTGSTPEEALSSTKAYIDNLRFEYAESNREMDLV